MATRSGADWSAVEADYRAGKLSNRQIAKKSGVSESAIRKRAEAGGWVRTKTQGAHRPEPSKALLPQPAAPREPREAPTGHVELGQDLALRLLGELDATTTHRDAIEDAIHDETRDDENGRRRQAMLQAVSLPGRAMTLKTIAQAMAVLKEVGQGSEKGKKEQRQENAQKSASGRFAPPAAPKLVVNNGR